MPSSFKAAIAGFIAFVLGTLLIAFACLEGGWESIGHFVWGTLTAAAGLVISFLSSTICAITKPAWRRWSLLFVLASVLLLIGLFLFARAA
jgi:hypothetical protein